MFCIQNLIRIIDIVLALIGLILLFPLLLIIYIINLIIYGSPLFVQERVGLNSKVFILIKFRTMKIGTRNMATHLIDEKNITVFGKLLRTLKIDELPQLWNVLLGEMSIVGPRPCLVTQKKLIYERKKKKVFKMKPGLTGLAQIKGITMSNPILLAKTDFQMMKKMTLLNYFCYIFLTLSSIIKSKS